MKKLLSAIFFLLMSACSFGQGATVLFPPLSGPQGQSIPFALLTFCTSPATFDSLGNCTNTITVYKDATLNPANVYSAIRTDGLGNFPPNVVTTTALWFPANANYCYTATGSNILHSVNVCTPFSIPVAGGSSPSFASITLTGNINGASTTVYCLNSDSGITRQAAASFNIGTCTPGDQSGTLNLTTLNVLGNLTATGGQNIAKLYNLSNIRIVDGVKFAATNAGIQAAITDIGGMNAGTVIVPANVTGTDYTGVSTTNSKILVLDFRAIAPFNTAGFTIAGPSPGGSQIVVLAQISADISGNNGFAWQVAHQINSIINKDLSLLAGDGTTGHAEDVHIGVSGSGNFFIDHAAAGTPTFRLGGTVPGMILSSSAGTTGTNHFFQIINNITDGTQSFAVRTATRTVEVSRLSYIGTAPTSCTVTGAGASQSCTPYGGSTDSIGRLQITSAGAGPAATGTLTLTLSSSLGANAVECVFTPNNTHTAWNARVSFIQNNSTQTVPQATWDNNAAALAGGGAQYDVQYTCGGR